MPLKLLDPWWKHDFACAAQGRSTEVIVDTIVVNAPRIGRRILTTEEVFAQISKHALSPVSFSNLTVNTYRISLPTKILVINPTTAEMLSEAYREQGILLADDARLYLPETNGLEGSLTVWWLPT